MAGKLDSERGDSSPWPGSDVEVADVGLEDLDAEPAPSTPRLDGAARDAGLLDVGLDAIADTWMRPADVGSVSPRLDGALDGTVGGTIRVATFNIENFGRVKRNDAQLMGRLAEIVRRYDLVAVQEIVDVSEQVPEAFLTAINRLEGPRYDYIASPRTGRNADDLHSEEQYAFYFNTETIQALDAGELYDDGIDDAGPDHFQREPFVARFAARGGALTFVLITVHVAPRLAASEIEAIDEVFHWAQGRYPEEDDFICLGDLNAGCGFISVEQLDEMALRYAPYVWVVPDDANTNLGEQDCAYDRIIFRSETRQDYTGRWGVDTEAFSDTAISDHWPVWLDLWTARDLRASEGRNPRSAAFGWSG